MYIKTHNPAKVTRPPATPPTISPSWAEEVEEDVVVEDVVVVVVADVVVVAIVVVVDGSPHFQYEHISSPDTHWIGQWSGKDGVGQPSVRYCGHRPCSDGDIYDLQL